MATVAKSLLALKQELKELWPHRSTVTDGFIGDASHQKTKSSHNPDRYGVVRAGDYDMRGLTAHQVNQFLACVIGDPRVHYVIYKAKIYSVKYGWTARPSSGHGHWVHVNLKSELEGNGAWTLAQINQAANDTSPWLSPIKPQSQPEEIDMNVEKLEDFALSQIVTAMYEGAPKGRELVNDVNNIQQRLSVLEANVAKILELARGGAMQVSPELVISGGVIKFDVKNA